MKGIPYGQNNNKKTCYQMAEPDFTRYMFQEQHFNQPIELLRQNMQFDAVADIYGSKDEIL